jgi:hypothetical protein
MAYVTHTVNVQYGSYYEEGIKVLCNENDDMETIKGKIRRELSLNFLSMATYSVKITDTKYHSNEY